MKIRVPPIGGILGVLIAICYFLHSTKRAEIYILKEKRRRCLVTEGVNAFLTTCEETSEPANSAERVMEIENISSDGVEDDNTFEKSN